MPPFAGVSYQLRYFQIVWSVILSIVFYGYGGYIGFMRERKSVAMYFATNEWNSHSIRAHNGRVWGLLIEYSI